jgi:hypothetical protein
MDEMAADCLALRIGAKLMVGKTRQFLRGFLLVAAALTGIGGPSNPAPGAPSTPQSAQSRQTDKQAHWNVLGRSVEDRVIEYRQFGQGDEQVLVVGPLEGDTTAAIALVELLADHLEQFPRRTSGQRVTLVRDPNPDGRLRRSPYNARGVRLNQNFPTRGWHKVPSGVNWLSGREPESEPETRVLVDLIDDVRPDRVIVLGGTLRQAELTYFGPAEELARNFAKAGSLRPAAAQVGSQQGSLAVYAGDDRKTPTLVLRVPAGMRPDQAWVTYKRALLAAIGGEADDATVKGPADDAASPEPPAQTNAVLATVKGTSKEDRPRLHRTAAPRVLTADELQSGGELVPVVRPPAAGSAVANETKRDAASLSPVAVQPPLAVQRVSPFGPANPRSRGGPDVTKPSVPYPTSSALPKEQSVFPPAALYRPTPTTGNTLAPTSGTNATTSSQPKSIDRLPRVDASSAPPKALPQPIPFYPETGY